MVSEVDNVPSHVANVYSVVVVSEADPALRQPPGLQDFVEDTSLEDTISSPVLPSDSANDEQAPLLGKPRQDKLKPWYRKAAPKLLVPLAIVTALCRGMTLAPRVEVLTQIACHERHIERDRAYAPAWLYNNSSQNPDFSIGLDMQSPILAVVPSKLPVRMSMTPIAHVGKHSEPASLSSDACRADPVVQQGAAKLQTLVLVLAGTLGSLTAGFWGHFGDKHGRKVVISVGIFAMLAGDCGFVLAASQTANPTYSFLTASHILIISPVIEGMFGGFPTLQAALNAYISDSTPAGTSRAKIFARFFGFIFVGVAIGPTLGNLLPFNPFYSSIALGTTNLILVLLLLPESLTKEKRDALAASRVLATPELPTPENQTWLKRTSGYVIGALQRTLAPMAVLFPKKQEIQGEAISGRNWNLTYLAISLSLYLLTISIYSVKFLYAQHAFGWGGQQLSYYLSLMGCLRALNLIVTLPYLIKVYKPKLSDYLDSPSAISPQGSTTVLNTPARAKSPPAIPTSTPAQPPLPVGPSPANAHSIGHSIFQSQEQQFDLLVARLSISMDFLSYFLLCWATSATGFVLTTALSSFGGGTSPALQSLALGTLRGDEKDIGKLFGALSMLSSISSTILSPLVFGPIYSMTVAIFPKAIFVVATAVLTIALVFLALFQPARPLRLDAEGSPPRDRS